MVGQLVESQEELVGQGSGLQADHRADIRQHFTLRGVGRTGHRGIQGDIGLAHLRDRAVDADADTLHRNAGQGARGNGRIQRDEGRLIEHVAVAVVLAGRHHDVGL